MTTGDVTTYYYLGGKMIVQRKGTTLNYIHQDQVSSPLVTSDSDGDLTSSIKYYPFGECWQSQGNMPTDKLFTGQRLDSTGLYYYGARYYDSTIGRFISADTIVPKPFNPQELNRYTYCLNNPLRYVDPTGHQPEADDYAYIALCQANGIDPNAGLALVLGDNGKVVAVVNIEHFAGWNESTPDPYDYRVTWNSRPGDPFDLQGTIEKALQDLREKVESTEFGRNFVEFMDKLSPYFFGAAFAIGMTMGPKGSPSLWSNTANETAVARQANHIFSNPGHNFDPLLAKFGGSQTKAFKALEVATQDYVTANKLTTYTEGIVVNVRGIDVTVRGVVVNGQARIGTAFIP